MSILFTTFIGYLSWQDDLFAKPSVSLCLSQWLKIPKCHI